MEERERRERVRKRSEKTGNESRAGKVLLQAKC